MFINLFNKPFFHCQGLYNDLYIVEDIKIRRLGWVGHIVRMEEGRIPKKVLNGKVHNTRPVGRPRIRWEDAV
jgi:hypothetical protein